MSATETGPATAAKADPVPLPALVVFRGIGQIWFQESALTGALFALGIAISSPIMAAGIVAGAAIGTAVAHLLKFDKAELLAGIYGFNPALVGIATLFFFQPGAASLGLLVAGCAVAAVLTRLARQFVPFPTYTAPFVVTTWAVFFIGQAAGAVPVTDYPILVPNPPVGPVVESTLHGIGQVMFQASVWTGLLFLAGIAVNDRTHAAWVLAAAILGTLVVSYHLDAAERAIDPERLVVRDQFENVRLGLYGYNATLAAVALFLWRRSLIPALLGIALSVPLTELVPRLGVPALTAPFVLATWIVLALGCIDGRFFRDKTAA
ncbi:MAG: urea transporter [Gemmataceae bacterium]